MKTQPKRITANDLPITLTDLKVINQSNILMYIAKFVFYIAIIFLVVGIGTLLFGPSSLRVGISGPTFTEFVLLNPGPITSIGAGLTFIGNLLDAQSMKCLEKYVEENYVLYNNHGNPAKEAVIGLDCEDGNKLVLSYLPIDNTEEEKIAAQRTS
ncbi:hypothetical protein [Fodinibius halophilus]|uniref:Uncharacterized protein n=1 Tax=Fodinibius halophilus TaxID=1736908 RepID=A0A6M1T5D1_9BACT|nr:hypothetical protein [Fodinibius halophilus]NGP87171.1 hypothetical protein [Fodinibius halophilus]